MSKMLRKQRKWLTVTLGFTSLLLFYWLFFSNGLPVYWGPSASAKDIAAGRELFEHEWTPNDPLAHGDGLGPVFNAKSCAACHFQGGLGGGGEISHNATAFEILPRPGKPEMECGTIHNYSIDPKDKESFTVLRKLFPVNRAITTTRSVEMANCPPTIQRTTADFDPLRTISTQSSAIFGSGWIDLISEKAIVQNFRRRSFQGLTQELAMNFDGVPLGRLRTLPDGRIGRFGWKAQFATLEDFTATACANEIGLGTPMKPQACSVATKAKPEVPADLDKKQFQQLVAFVSTIPRPVETMPTDAKTATSAKHGEELFAKVGCTTCHVPDLGGVKGMYTDFLLYSLDEPLPPGGGGSPYGPAPLPEFPRPEGEPPPSDWRTPPLWGVADSAPYFHDGTADTLHAAILRHNGDAKSVKKAFADLPPADQQAIVAFLETLKAPPTATALKDMAVTKLPKKK